MSKVIDDISDTARWIAYYRALETERPQPLFRDPFARKLAGDKGHHITHSFDPHARHAWALAVRTYIIDQLLLKVIEHERIDTVLDLACGLDTRAYRLKLPQDLRWYDVDLPKLLEAKHQLLKDETPACRLEQVQLDLADTPARQKFFQKINEQSQNVLILTEGLLIYLGEKENQSLALDLASQPHFRHWIMDLYSPLAITAFTKIWGKKFSSHLSMKFGPISGSRFFLPYGWKESEFYSFLKEGIRVNRKPSSANLWKLASVFFPASFREKIYRISGIVLLNRT